MLNPPDLSDEPWKVTAKVLTYLEKIENSVLRMVNKEQFRK